ncbi:hypothetical protein HW450_00475 [Corynebacterium hindlerae]|uniref:Uncharacterized protein n=1 Tax=Corynebacterium hindlerae TaxID=699041 RepID=A0A7G5FF86_9CORY|nr:hypothetical protein [Corynebacterium hindlerae]QMV85277.1 hypothetical protein HW450_00475 [Corynebacterium hindlerae]QTH58841.1 hypothetical protein J5O04_08325 [Corynebacterium hindlerae]
METRFFIQAADDITPDWQDLSTWAPSLEIAEQLLEVFQETVAQSGELKNPRLRIVTRPVGEATAIK